MEIHIFSANVLNPVASVTKILSLPIEAKPDGLCIVPRPSGYTQPQQLLFLTWESENIGLEHL